MPRTFLDQNPSKTAWGKCTDRIQKDAKRCENRVSRPLRVEALQEQGEVSTQGRQVVLTYSHAEVALQEHLSVDVDADCEHSECQELNS